jgi:hypothetical protein
MLSAADLVDAAQTAALLTMTGIMLYAVNRLRVELKQASSALGKVLNGQKEMHDRINHLWRRIDEIELRQGLRNDGDQLVRLKRLMAAFDAALKAEGKEE